MTFDYTASAELFVPKRKGGARARLSYRRFATAAEAVCSKKPGSKRRGKVKRPPGANIWTSAQRCTPDLACYCLLDQPCHAEVLLELANQ